MQQSMLRGCSSQRCGCFQPAKFGVPVRPLRAAFRTSAADKQSGTEITSSAPLALSRRQALVRLPGSALLASLAAVLAAEQLSTAVPPAVAAPGPRQLGPDAKAAVAAALNKIITKPKAPVILRLAYHDAATFSAAAGNGGANASIQFELDRPENTGLKRGWRLIEQVSDALKKTPAEGKLSNADLIALAGAHAVAVCGGPVMDAPVGRVDAAGPDPEYRLVSEKAAAAALVANFAEKGLGVQQLVALSGAHTIGGKGFGDPVTFDNAYYTALLAKPWLNPNDSMASMIGLPSDHALPEDPECLKYIQAYADDQQLFFMDFAAAYLQLTSMGAVWA